VSLNLHLNGQERYFAGLEQGSPLSALVQELGLKPDRVAIERNGEIAARNQWDATPLHDGDKLELVHFVGGGSFAQGFGRL